LTFADWCVPGVVLAFGVVVTWFSLRLDRAPEAMVGQSMQPRDFPIFLMALIAVLTIVLVVDMIRHGSPERRPLLWQTWVTVALVAVFAVLSLTLDMFLGLAVALFGLSLTFGERRIWVAAAVAILTPAIIFFAFDLGLGVRFPRGVLTELYY